MSQSSPHLDHELQQLLNSANLVPVAEAGKIIRAVVQSLPWEKMIKARESKLAEGDNASVLKAVTELDVLSIRDSVLPNIERELALIADAMTTATESILRSLEEIQDNVDVANDPGTARSILETEITKLYEACSFQDVTGQRMSKIIKLIKRIELRIEGLLCRSGDEAACERYQHLHKVSIQQSETSDIEDVSLQGPTQGPLATTQAEIDKLF